MMGFSTAGLRHGWFWQIGPILAAGLIWELLARGGVFNPMLFPAPSSLFGELVHSRMLDFYKAPYARGGTELLVLNSVAASLARVAAGIAIGFSTALATGCCIAYFKMAERLLMPIITIMAPISPVAWIPFAMIIFGIGNKPALFVVILSVYFVITIATVASIRNVNPEHLLWAEQYGATRWQLLRYIVLPSIMPALFVVLRVNSFAAWMSVLAAEMVGVSQGLGQMIMVGRSLFNMKLILIAMMLIGICGYILDRLLEIVQQRVLWWKPDASLS